MYNISLNEYPFLQAIIKKSSCEKLQHMYSQFSVCYIKILWISTFKYRKML